MARRSLGLVALLVTVIMGVAVVPASAATGTYLRLAHLSPDTPTVDVLVTAFSGATLRLDGVNYGDVSTYRQITPGRYTLQMRPAGAPESSPAIVSGTLDAVEGGAYTAAGLGPRADLAVKVLNDDLTPPGPGQSRVRIVQGAEQAGKVSIRWQDASAFDGIAFGTASNYVTVPAGVGSLDIAPTTGAAAGVPVRLAPGGVYSVIIVQRNGALSADLRTDAAGAEAAPSGGIDTGLGGTAAGGPGTAPDAIVPVALLGIAVLGIAVLGIAVLGFTVPGVTVPGRRRTRVGGG